MLKIGIIGSGFGLYGLLPAFNSIKNCRVICVCGNKTPRLLNYCKSIKLRNIYTDWKAMLDNEDLDAVALAVPPDIQYQIAKYAIKKKIHVFAEKPLAANYKQALELTRLAKNARIVNMVDFIFSEIEEWAKVKNIIAKKIYGKLKHISVNWNFLSYDIKNKISSWKTDVKKGGGALSFYFSHALYYLEYYAGKITDVRSVFAHARESKKGGEVGMDMLIKFKDGIMGDAHVRANDRGLNRHKLEFICERATVILENENSVVNNFTIKVYENGVYKKISVKKIGPTLKKEDERVRIVRKNADRFVKACIRKVQTVPSFTDGLRVQELIEKIRSRKI